MKSLLTSRSILWLVLALPGLWILSRWTLTPTAYGYGHAIRDSGLLAVWLLMLTLAVTPIRLLSRRNALSVWLMRRRRDLGLASFAYATGHTMIYVAEKSSLNAVLYDIGAPDIMVGWLALALIIPLAVTSNDIATRALRRTWKRLHRLVYPAAILTFLHWVWATFDPTTAYIQIAVLAAIQLVRIWLQFRQRVT